MAKYLLALFTSIRSKDIEAQLDVKTEASNKRPDVILWTAKAGQRRTVAKMEGKSLWSHAADKSRENARAIESILLSFRHESPDFYKDMTPKFALALVDDEIAVYVVEHFEKMFLAYKAGTLPILTRIPADGNPLATITNFLASWRGFGILVRQVKEKMVDRKAIKSTTAQTRLFPGWMTESQ
ncbi:hypothetical protein HDU87_000050 [Geranomyces variabilis]|uniref:Uncharacterized protein n=1 Tax=Geranomyces variabilis TaxID=109894 RepID=A0AAD5TRY2_9FUNG|nr:hypothetical protein HDU87_000050 [Geranomyces variabilis]